MVAIARKMPRLLECSGVLPGQTNVISERALPWVLRSEGPTRRFRLIDDVLNVGTTLTHYAKYIHDNGSNFKTEVKVFCKRKKKCKLQDKSPLFDSADDISWEEVLSEEDFQSFETLLPVQLLTLGKPYDLDFPIISVRTTSDHHLNKPEEWLQLLRSTFPSVHNLTMRSQREEGISSISVIDPLDVELTEVLPLESFDLSPPAKVRLYVSSKQDYIKVVPMWIPTMRSTFLEELPLRLTGNLEEIANSITYEPIEGKPFTLEPVYNLLVYLISFHYACLFLKHLAKLLGGIDIVGVESHDLKLLFGTTLGDHLVTILNKYLQSNKGEAKVRSRFPSYERPTKPQNPSLCKPIISKLKSDGFANEHPQRVLRETIRILDDSVKGNNPDAQEPYPEYSRLRMGLTLCDLWWIVSRISPRQGTSLEELSFLLDYDVDIGVMIPVVTENENLYFRCYRKGEANPLEFSQYMHDLLREHEKVFTGTHLQTTHLTKILAIMAIMHPGYLPLRPSFELYGTVPYIILTDKTEPLFENALYFLYRKGIIDYKKLPKELPLFEEVDT